MKRALFVLGAIIFAVAAVARAATLPDDGLDPEGDRVVNRGSLIDAHNSPSLARNPKRADDVVLTHRVDRIGFSAQLQWSDDGGREWRLTELPLPAGLDRPFAPDAAFAPDGTLYVSYVNLTGEGNVPDNLWVARSSDGGRTLSTPVRVGGRLSFQSRLAVGPDGTVYLTWLQAESVGLLKLTGSPNPIVVSRSTDGGRTFSAPAPISDPTRERVAAASPVVDADGRLLVLYEDFKDDRRDFEFLEGPPAEDPFALVLTVSEDGGRSFSPGVEVESGVVAGRRFMVFLPEFPSLATGPGRSVLVAWADARNGDEDVFVRRSTDGGRSWAAAVRVNDNQTGDGTSQYLPRVATSPSGRIDVLFLDRRHDPRNLMTEAFLAWSDDDGRTFHNERVSSTSFDSRSGPFIDATFPVDFGSRLGLVSDDQGALASWTDTRLAREDSGRQDIAVARVTHRSSTPGGWASVAVLALLAAACAWQAARRPGERSTPLGSKTELEANEEPAWSRETV